MTGYWTSTEPADIQGVYRMRLGPQQWVEFFLVGDVPTSGERWSEPIKECGPTRSIVWDETKIPLIRD